MLDVVKSLNANFLLTVPVKEFGKLINIRLRYGQKCDDTFLWTTVYMKNNVVSATFVGLTNPAQMVCTLQTFAVSVLNE